MMGIINFKTTSTIHFSWICEPWINIIHGDNSLLENSKLIHLQYVWKFYVFNVW
jgi:hypothetical protein